MLKLLTPCVLDRHHELNFIAAVQGSEKENKNLHRFTSMLPFALASLLPFSPLEG